MTKLYIGVWHPGHQHVMAGQLIRCQCCTEVTWARAAASPTLEQWRVESFPDKCYCPLCAKSMRPMATIQAQPKKTKHIYSKYRGVSWGERMAKPWRAQIHVVGTAHGKRIGDYATELEAAHAYDVACWEIYHNPNKLNFPEEMMEKV